MDYKAIQKQCYLDVESALSESDIIDSSWKGWLNQQATSPPEEYHDPIDFLAAMMEKMQPGRFSHNKQVISIGDAINRDIGAMIPRIPFSNRLLKPSAFYEKNPEIKELCATLLCPVSYAEGREAIGIITINPVAALNLQKHLVSYIEEHFQIRPYITFCMANTRGGWAQVCDRHFNSNLTSEII